MKPTKSNPSDSNFADTFRRAVHNTDIPRDHKYLLLAMMDHANYSDGRDCRPSTERLAKYCQAHRNTIGRWRKHLEQAGWLHLTAKGDSGEGRGGRRRVNVYALSEGRPFTITDGEVEFLDRVNVTVLATRPRKVEPVKVTDGLVDIAALADDF